MAKEQGLPAPQGSTANVVYKYCEWSGALDILHKAVEVLNAYSESNELTLGEKVGAERYPKTRDIDLDVWENTHDPQFYGNDPVDFEYAPLYEDEETKFPGQERGNMSPFNPRWGVPEDFLQPRPSTDSIRVEYSLVDGVWSIIYTDDRGYYGMHETFPTEQEAIDAAFALKGDSTREVLIRGEGYGTNGLKLAEARESSLSSDWYSTPNSFWEPESPGRIPEWSEEQIRARKWAEKSLIDQRTFNSPGSMVSISTNTTDSLNYKEELVPYVENFHQKVPQLEERDGSTSTTIIQQVKSEDFYAPIAIEESDASKMTQIISTRQQSTSSDSPEKKMSPGGLPLSSLSEALRSDPRASERM
jgi:hypothetical protein